MNAKKKSSIVVLNNTQLCAISAGNEQFCAAMAGAALASGFLGAYPAALTFGAIFMATCWDGHY